MRIQDIGGAMLGIPVVLLLIAMPLWMIYAGIKDRMGFLVIGGIALIWFEVALAFIFWGTGLK